MRGRKHGRNPVRYAVWSIGVLALACGLDEKAFDGGRTGESTGEPDMASMWSCDELRECERRYLEMEDETADGIRPAEVLELVGSEMHYLRWAWDDLPNTYLHLQATHLDRIQAIERWGAECAVTESIYTEPGCPGGLLLGTYVHLWTEDGLIDADGSIWVDVAVPGSAGLGELVIRGVVLSENLGGSLPNRVWIDGQRIIVDSLSFECTGLTTQSDSPSARCKLRNQDGVVFAASPGI